MPSFKTNALLSAVAGAASVMAHGHVESIIADGTQYEAFGLSNAYNANHAPLVGWSTTALDNGFVAPSAFGTGDIACHRGATNAEGTAVVAAGGEIFLQWDTWPESHKGPVIDYLASCGSGDCTTVDKASLEFFKIAEVGLISGAGSSGTWASDVLIEQGNGWLVKIPATLAAGDYVLRHEIIALHASGQPDGAQNYPQCINIRVTGGGSELPTGTVATSLYTAEDAGILYDLYSSTSYEIPGPAAPAIASAVEQAVPAATATSPAVVGGGSGSAPAPAPSSPAETETPAAPVETEAPVAPAPSAPVEEPSAPAPSAPVEEPTAPAPVPSAPVEEPVEEPTPEVPAECPAAARRRARRAARRARRHARDVQAARL
ncbi:endoglucanase-4 [Verticillium alfalfae VaMs.102]|uniref:lytic cellulose monooxygenase (C4-dehydrogenating) n=1 Tax=Verticillium alfalfae (strain VaMs.102 / ATCC MYA-4576 / FGSC 10136) TaxID=526221 RepID=C9SYS5_VERA1|nr:endoglucanase-4 [Verticillium alfalfae VaMs.102]EEY23940.1 endoglucanase-4 [Verticillium alfalfae VaMs.102]